MGPEATARTLMIGALWGVSPTVGFQMIGIAITWVLVDRLARIRFNMPIALVLTMVTNPLTVPPIYGTYYALGCALLDCSGAGFQVTELVAVWDQLIAWKWAAFAGDLAALLGGAWGVIFVGSAPFVLFCAAGGYFAGLRLGARLDRRRGRRQGVDHRSAKAARSGRSLGQEGPAA